MRKILSGIMVLVVLAAPSVVLGAEILGGFEQTTEEVEEKGDFFEGAIVGAGFLSATSAYTGVDDRNSAVPLVVWNYKNFFIDGTAAGYTVVDNKHFGLSLIGKPRLMGYDSHDSPALNGMDDREWSLDGGLRLELENNLFVLKITGISDLLNEHQGQEISAVLSKEFLEGFFTPRVGVKWWSRDLVDYYFGVKGTEVTLARPDYEGDSSTNFVAGFTIALPLGEKFAAIVDFEYEGLGNGVKDSPIVDEDETFTYAAGVVYRF